MAETHILLDESGYTGQDLLNPDQPIFCIASTTIDDTTAERYHAELLERSSAREVKHSQLARRPFGQEKIVNFLKQITADHNTFAVWLCYKPFALLTYFVDLWCEPLALRSGLDLYKDGAALAMSNLTYYALPAYTNDEFLTSILRDFQAMMTRRSKQSYGRLRTNLIIKYNSSEKNVRQILVPFLGAIDQLGYQHLRGLLDLAIDLPAAGFVELCHFWRRQMPGPFVLYHDQSTHLARGHEIWDILLSKDMPPREFGSGDRRAIFPLNVERVVFVDSVLEKQIQLCDVVAGAVAAWARGIVDGKTSAYLERLQEVDLQPLVKSAIWPEFKVDPDELGMRGWSSAPLDYITAELEKRAP